MERFFTPFELIEKMFDMMDENVFSDPSKTFMDAGAGSGFFSIALYWRLMSGLSEHLPDENERSRHIIEKMLHFSELREENVNKLISLFGNNANCYSGNYLEYTENDSTISLVILHITAMASKKYLPIMLKTKNKMARLYG